MARLKSMLFLKIKYIITKKTIANNQYTAPFNKNFLNFLF